MEEEADRHWRILKDKEDFSRWGTLKRRGTCVSKSLVGEKNNILAKDTNNVLACSKTNPSLSNIFSCCGYELAFSLLLLCKKWAPYIYACECTHTHHEIKIKYSIKTCSAHAFISLAAERCGSLKPRVMKTG